MSSHNGRSKYSASCSPGEAKALDRRWAVGSFGCRAATLREARCSTSRQHGHRWTVRLNAAVVFVGWTVQLHGVVGGCRWAVVRVCVGVWICVLRALAGVRAHLHMLWRNARREHPARDDAFQRHAVHSRVLHAAAFPADAACRQDAPVTGKRSLMVLRCGAVRVAVRCVFSASLRTLRAVAETA